MSFLQSKEWLEFQISIGRKGWRFDDGIIRANIIQHDIPFSKNYLYVPHGPEIDLNSISGGIRNELEKFMTYLRNLAKDNKSIHVKMEPLSDSVAELLVPLGFRKSKKEIQPSRSILVDLSKPEEDLLAHIHHKTRYNIKVAKRNINTEEGINIDQFWSLIQKTAKRDRFHTHTKEYYQKLVDFFSDGREISMSMIIAKNNNRPVAAMLALIYKDSVYYIHGASDYQFRSLMAPYALHWHAMRKYKNMGLKYYDFWGINSLKWPGVTRFKLGWGGREIEYPGSFDLSVSKFWYLAYKTINKIRK